MANDVLCTCVWCLQVLNGQDKSVSIATHTRHLIKQKKICPDQANTLTLQQHLATSVQPFLPVADTLTRSSLSSSSVSTLFQTNWSEDGYNHIIDKLASITDLNMDSADEQNNQEESLEVQEELIELLEFQEELIEFIRNISENLIKGLKLYQIKDKHNMSEAAFNEILNVLEIPEISLYKLKKYLENLYKDKAHAKTLCYRHNYMSLYDYALGNKIGPKAPKDFNSFLRPLVDELKLLQDSVPCIDSVTENSFTLYAHILSFSGDLLALAKVMYMTGHNFYKAYCFCSIQGIYCQRNRHIYFPLKPPTRISGYQYNPKTIEQIDSKLHKREVLMVEHWSSTFFKDNQAANSDYILSNSDWYKAEVNQKLFDSSLEIPAYSEDHVFATDNAQEKLYSLSRKYYMNKSELKHLKTYYITALEICAH
ncbi:15955_t:CDS:10 [Gigaspora margarita]|uniref:15955_t:CDS:1 n=1 Tax=Gigaspora margarita TaxID=4874 RepID=A0ABN7UZ64_GIGMA|nr:15955_t:CDS:10 [Gigaspora margarita]